MFKTTKNISYNVDLQNCLNNFYLWCVNNKLSINIKQCNFITFSLVHNPINYIYCINSMAQTPVSCSDKYCAQEESESDPLTHHNLPPPRSHHKYYKEPRYSLVVYAAPNGKGELFSSRQFFYRCR